MAGVEGRFDPRQRECAALGDFQRKLFRLCGELVVVDPQVRHQRSQNEKGEAEHEGCHEDLAECLSSGRSIDYNETIYLTKGHILYSNRSNPMFTIVEDTVGRHDILYSPCSSEMFQKLYNFDASHPSCFGNLAGALSEDVSGALFRRVHQ